MPCFVMLPLPPSILVPTLWFAPKVEIDSYGPIPSPCEAAQGGNHRASEATRAVFLPAIEVIGVLPGPNGRAIRLQKYPFSGGLCGVTRDLTR